MHRSCDQKHVKSKLLPPASCALPNRSYIIQQIWLTIKVVRIRTQCFSIRAGIFRKQMHSPHPPHTHRHHPPTVYLFEECGADYNNFDIRKHYVLC